MPNRYRALNLFSMYYVYVIRNKVTKKTYIGFSNDLRRRFGEHKRKTPELLYYEAYKSEKDARDRERKLKQRGQTLRWLKERIKVSLRE